LSYDPWSQQHRQPFAHQISLRINLLVRANGVINVVTAVITTKGENTMTSITEATETAPAAERKADKPARAGARRASVAQKKAKSGKKASRAKKASKAAKKATGARAGSKSAKVLDLLRQTNGATLKELMKATGWQAHSVRGFLSGAVGKKMGLKVASIKGEDGERSYSLKA
jgi:Protein of unknown function (DUF3489)